MADRICLAAFTPPGATYPPYINVSAEGDVITLTIRSACDESGPYPKPGSEGVIHLTRRAFNEFMGQLKG